MDASSPPQDDGPKDGPGTSMPKEMAGLAYTFST